MTSRTFPAPPGCHISTGLFRTVRLPSTSSLAIKETFERPNHIFFWTGGRNVFELYTQSIWTCFVAQLVKNLAGMWETWVQSLGWEDPLEKRKASHSSILAWRIPRTV